MSVDLEFAIRQDIRNNPVVREVDVDQKREFRRMIGLAVLLVATLLFSAIPHFRIVTTGYEVERLRHELRAAQSRHQTLRVQLESRRAPEVIERRARRELGMVAPTPDETVVLERVTGAQPPRAVVAQAR